MNEYLYEIMNDAKVVITEEEILTIRHKRAIRNQKLKESEGKHGTEND